jgi:hypothetical protein
MDFGVIGVASDYHLHDSSSSFFVRCFQRHDFANNMTPHNGIVERFLGLSGGEENDTTVSTAILSHNGTDSFTDLPTTAILHAYFELSLNWT